MLPQDTPPASIILHQLVENIGQDFSKNGVPKFGSADFYSNNVTFSCKTIIACWRPDSEEIKIQLINLASSDRDTLIGSAKFVHSVHVYIKTKGNKHILAEEQHPHEMTLIVYHSHKHKLQAESRVTKQQSTNA